MLDTMCVLRLVLMPHGPPKPELNAACLDAVRRCNGDLTRVIDAPTTNLEAFARHVARMKAIASNVAPLVVLTHTSPLALALTGTRRTLETSVPALKKAAWTVFYDRNDDPFFEAQADAIGILEPRSDCSAMWASPDGKHYLFIARSDDFELGGQIDELLSLPPASSRGDR